MPKSLRLANELKGELDGKHWTVFKCQAWVPRQDLWELQDWQFPIPEIKSTRKTRSQGPA